MYHKLEIISLRDGGGLIKVENNPEKFTGNIIKIIIEYFGTEIKYNLDKQISFKEIPLRKGYSNPIYKEIHYNNGLKISEKTKNESDFYPNLIYKYDSNSNLSKIIFPSENHKFPFEEYIFKYNRDKQLVSKTKHQLDKFKWCNSYYYDETGLLLKEVWSGPRDPVGEGLEFIYKYNSKKKLISKISLDFYKILYEYDNEFRILKIQKDIKERLSKGIELEKSIETFSYMKDEGFISTKINEMHKSCIKRVYNKNNELIKIYDEYHGITKFSYKYDQRNNWNYSVQSINNKPVLIIKREFEYELKEPATNVGKSNKDFLKEGDVKFDLGDFSGAIENFDEAIRLKPNYKAAFNNRGLSKMKLSNFKGCIEDCTRAIEIDIDYSYPYKHRGVAKYNLNDLSGALIDLNKAIGLNSDYKEAFYYRGIIKNALKNEACEDWSRAGELGYFEAYEKIKEFCN